MLGKFIHKQRTKHNMTQEYLASKLGVSRPTYMHIERGERELTITEAKNLGCCIFYDVGRLPGRSRT